MTKQETFDIVARHLLTQNEQAIDDGVCKLRGPCGLKCAAGCLIPDELYDQTMEGQYVTGHPLGELISKLGHDARLVQHLQDVHDDHGPEEWASELEIRAEWHGLKATVVTELRGPAASRS